MKQHTLPDRCTALLLALSLLLSLAACGDQAKATTMHLKRAEGTVAVSDDAGEDVPLLDDLGLYSGYGVNTRLASFAWIDLDDVKLTKMDEKSEIAIQKEGKLLEIEVKSGSLFFNVTEPLEEDETMHIRTSTMMVGIRGTCGWVEVPDASHMNVYLLEGKVECSNGDSTAAVSAGEMAVMTEAGEITVEKFSRAEVPAFVAEEIEGDDELTEAIGDGPDTGVTSDGILAGVEKIGENQYIIDIDFEADGKPENLNFQIFNDYDVNKKEFYPGISFSIRRFGPEESALSVHDSPWVNINGINMNEPSCQKLSLVESGSRLFIKHYWAIEYPDGIFENERYFGSVAQQDGAEQDWGWVEEIWHNGDDSYSRLPKEHGFVANEPPDDCSAEEYAAVSGAYNELLVLVYSQDGETLLITPAPSEMEELPQSTVTP